MQSLSELPEIEKQGVLSVAPSATISEVATMLAENNVGAVVVLDDGRRLVGIVSERDIVRAAAKADPGAMDEPVSAVMSREVQTCAPSEDIESLLARMDEHRIRHLPIVADEGVAGIVSIRDLMSALLVEMRRQNEDLRDMSDLLADMYAEAASADERLEDVA
jgi:CBS domain-containing protein